MLPKRSEPIGATTPRGGWRQRHFNKRAREESHGVPRIGRMLLEDWCGGVITTPKLHAYVQAATEDGINHPFLDRLLATFPYLINCTGHLFCFEISDP